MLAGRTAFLCGPFFSGWNNTRVHASMRLRTFAVRSVTLAWSYRIGHLHIHQACGQMRRYYWTPRVPLGRALAELRSFNSAGGKLNMTDSSALAAPCQTPFLLPHITDLLQCPPDPPLLALGKSHVSHVRRESGVAIAKLRTAHVVPVAG